MTSDSRGLDERYLEWLYGKSLGPTQNRNPSTSYWLLAVALFRKEFTWFIPNDDNRVEDGRELREIFLDETAAEWDRDWLMEGTSRLEMMVALSRRVAFLADEEPFEWFWILADNLGLRPYVDEAFTSDYNVDVDLILDRVINRTYNPDGVGGLFPLKRPEADQTQIEIFYQMAAYLAENHAI